MTSKLATWAIVLAMAGGVFAWYAGHRQQAARERRELRKQFAEAESTGRTAYAQYRYWAKVNGIFDAKNQEAMLALREAYLVKCLMCASDAECEKVARAIDSKPEDAVMWTVCRPSEDVSPRE